MTERTQKICETVKKAGEIILGTDRARLGIDVKAGTANFVTDYDKRVQELLRRELLAIVPDAVFIGEEGEQAAFPHKGKCFIADPIDGTTNFIRDFRMSAVSVGLLEDGKPVTAVILNPYTGELFTAERGCGAFCGDRRIRVSDRPLSDGIVLFGTSPYDRTLSRRTFDTAFGYFMRALDVRRSGSAALDLCSIACGRAELFFEVRLSPWDYAAGSLLVEEAGGVITDMDGNPLAFEHPCSVLARGSKVDDQCQIKNQR